MQTSEPAGALATSTCKMAASDKSLAADVLFLTDGKKLECLSAGSSLSDTFSVLQSLILRHSTRHPPVCSSASLSALSKSKPCGPLVDGHPQPLPQHLLALVLWEVELVEARVRGWQALRLPVRLPHTSSA